MKINKGSKKTALIYARVSTKNQDSRSQIVRCEQYCLQKDYTVEKIFEDNFTGGGDFINRPAMKELLNYVSIKKDKNYIVVFDDLKRFARDVEFHIRLRTTFKFYNLTPECLNYNFDDSPEGRFMETIYAAQAELERHQNRRQVIQKQEARLIAGYNAFHAPKGYSKVKSTEHGTIDVINNEGKQIKKALKKFATGELLLLADFVDFLKSKGVFGTGQRSKYFASARKILSNVFYAGYIEYKPWDVKRTKGKHEALITLKQYNKIQEKICLPNTRKVREDINPKYPLRGFVCCYYCKEKLTAARCRGRNAYYEKYFCRNKNCPLRAMGRSVIKSVDPEILNKEFKALVNKQIPTKDLLNLVESIFFNLWQEEEKNFETHLKAKLLEKQKLEDQIERLINLSSDPKTSETLRSRYESQIEKIDTRIKEIEQLGEKTQDLSQHCRTALNEVLQHLKNPYKIWESSDIEEKQRIFFFLFDTYLEYEFGKGFRTAKKSLPIRLFKEFTPSDSDYVEILKKSSNQMKSFVRSWYVELQKYKLD